MLLAEWAHPRSILALEIDDIEQFLDTRPLAPRTRYHYLSDLHTFYDWALAQRLIDEDPTARIVRPKSPRQVARPISTEDLEAAISAAEPEMKAMLLLGAYAGLRCKEIALLAVEDLAFDNEPPVLIVASGKGGHQRVIPMHPRLARALKRLQLPRAGYVFTKDEMKRPNKPWRVSQMLSRHFEDNSIDATAHQLRHWFGTNTYRQSRDLRVTQELLGHASPNTTVVYVAWSAADAAAAVAGLPDPSRAPPEAE